MAARPLEHRTLDLSNTFHLRSITMIWQTHGFQVNVLFCADKLQGTESAPSACRRRIAKEDIWDSPVPRAWPQLIRLPSDYCKELKKALAESTSWQPLPGDGISHVSFQSLELRNLSLDDDKRIYYCTWVSVGKILHKQNFLVRSLAGRSPGHRGRLIITFTGIYGPTVFLSSPLFLGNHTTIASVLMQKTAFYFL
jgi:hypothetical protein